MENEFLILSPIGIIFAFFLKEFFSFLKARKSPNGKDLEIQLAVINEKLDNHIKTFCRDLSETKEIVKEFGEEQTNIKIELVKLNAKMDAVLNK